MRTFKKCGFIGALRSFLLALGGASSRVSLRGSLPLGVEFERFHHFRKKDTQFLFCNTLLGDF